MNEETFDNALSTALREAPALTLDGAFADQLETRLREVAAEAPIAELEPSAPPRRRAFRIALVAVAVAAVLALAVALTVTRRDRVARPTFPIDHERYRARGTWFADGQSQFLEDWTIDPMSSAASFSTYAPSSPKGRTHAFNRVYARGRDYESVVDWQRDNGWPDAARLRLLRGKDWVDRAAANAGLPLRFARLPMQWQQQHLATDRRVQRIGPDRTRGIATTKYTVSDPKVATKYYVGMVVWVDSSGRVVRMEYQGPSALNLAGAATHPLAFVYDYSDFGTAPPVPVPDPATVVSERVLDDPSLCHEATIAASVAYSNSCSVHPGIATAGYRYTSTFLDVALDKSFAPAMTNTTGTVDAEHMAARVSITDTDHPGVTLDGVLIDGKHYGAPFGAAQMTFSIYALVDGSPFIGTFDVIDGLRRAGLSPIRVGHETTRGVATTHYRATHTITRDENTMGPIGAHLAFDVWIDRHARVVHMVITEQTPGDPVAHAHPQRHTDTFDFFDYGTRPIITKPSTP